MGRQSGAIHVGPGRFLFAIALAALAFGLLAAGAQATTLQVTTGGDDGGDCVAAPCATIQHAVDIAGAGDTIAIGPGTYVEQVLVEGRALTLEGAGAGDTTVEPPDTGIAAPWGGESSLRPVIGVRGADAVTVSGLTVDGQDRGTAAGGPFANFTGIAFLDAGGAVEDATVRGIRQPLVDGQLHGAQQDWAIRAENLDGQSRTLAIEGNEIVDFQKNGIDLRSPAPGLGVSVVDNRVVGAGDQTQAQNGIVLLGPITGVVEGNEVDELRCTVNPSCEWGAIEADPRDGYFATGILALGAGEIAVRDNLVSASDAGVYAEAATADTVVTVAGNRFLGSRAWGIAAYRGDFELRGNRVEGGAEGGRSNVGVGLYGSFAGDPPGAGTETTASLEGGTVSGADVGIEAVDPASDGLLVEAHANRLVELGTGIEAGSGVDLDAVDNWWGCNAGPGGLGCATTNGAVESTPNLVLAATATASQLEPGQSATVTARLDGDSAGNRVAGVPDGATVAFGSALGSLQPPTAALSGGAASSTFSAGSALGEAGITAGLDAETVAVPLTVVGPPPEEVPPPPAATPPSTETPPPAEAPPAIRPATEGGPRAVPANGIVTVASVSCPSGSCEVTAVAPKATIGGKSYGVTVRVPHTVVAGRPATVRVVLSKAARRALAKRGKGQLRLRLKVTTADGTVRTVTVRVKLRGGKKHRTGRG